MIKKLILLAFAIGSTALPSSLVAEELVGFEDAHAGAEKIVASVRKGDWSLCFKAMDPRMIVELGIDPEIMEEKIKEMQEQMEKMGMEVHEYIVKQSKEVYECESYDIVFLPTQMHMSLNGQEVRSRGFLIAAKYKGEKNWVYVDGGRKPPEELKRFYPELPKDVKFPESKVEILKKDDE